MTVDVDGEPHDFAATRRERDAIAYSDFGEYWLFIHAHGADPRAVSLTATIDRTN
jgi:hypothetical protein